MNLFSRSAPWGRQYRNGLHRAGDTPRPEHGRSPDGHPDRLCPTHCTARRTV